MFLTKLFMKKYYLFKIKSFKKGSMKSTSGEVRLEYHYAYVMSKIIYSFYPQHLFPIFFEKSDAGILIEFWLI